ncbi:hypothetical protein FZH90_20480, partial [Cronobacter sakazakii]
PRPKFLHTIYILTKTIICIKNQFVSVSLCLSVLLVFNALPPKCRHQSPSIGSYGRTSSMVFSSLLKSVIG